MKLKELLQGIQVRETLADPDLEIPRVVYDSRRVQPGDLFVAVAGFATDGNRFIPMALEKGAAAVVTARRPEGALPYVLVASDRLALAQLGANFYGHPAESMKMVGVTGTNGKTSVTMLLQHLLETARGAKVGLMGTVVNRIGGETLPTERTTPESLELQGLLARMRDAGCEYGVMEVSSHAIALDRVAGIEFDVTAFTNLTEDHLDFHKTMEEYCRVKASLFRRCRQGVVNLDSPYSAQILAQASCPVLTTSLGPQGDLRGEDVTLDPAGVRFTAVYHGRRVPVRLGIPGRFAVENALTALGIALCLDISLEAGAAALATAPGVPGRLEPVPTPGKPYTLLIDYAHTPDGLEKVLRSLKELCRGRLIAVYGCGGDRDPKKRPIMGKIGTELADLVIFTSDNPRSEDPMAILGDLLQGVEKKNYEVVENRVEAIRRAMDIGQKNDIIVLAGKGHETYQEIQGVKRPLDERKVVAEYLKETGESNG